MNSQRRCAAQRVLDAFPGISLGRPLGWYAAMAHLKRGLYSSRSSSAFSRDPLSRASMASTMPICSRAMVEMASVSMASRRMSMSSL